MATPPRSIRPAPILLEAVANNGGGRSFAHRLTQIADRYLEMLRRAELSAFSENEISAICDALNGTWLEPAAAIRGAIWVEVEDACLDGLAEKWRIDGPALVTKLRGLDYGQEVHLVERVEAFWHDVSDAGAE